MPGAFVVMAKSALPGAAKTRLCPPLLPEQAADLYVAMRADVAAQARAASRACGAQVVLSWAGPEAPPLDLAAAFDLVVEQRGAHLGARIESARSAGARAFGDPVIVMGSDAPALGAERMALAWARVEPGVVVVGPVEDGGYDCIGFFGDAPWATDDRIPWSTSGVVTATREAARRSGVWLIELSTSYDVDTGSDLQRLATDEEVLARCPRTRAALNEVLGT